MYILVKRITERWRDRVNAYIQVSPYSVWKSTAPTPNNNDKNCELNIHSTGERRFKDEVTRQVSLSTCKLKKCQTWHTLTSYANTCALYLFIHIKLSVCKCPHMTDRGQIAHGLNRARMPTYLHIWQFKHVVLFKTALSSRINKLDVNVMYVWRLIGADVGKRIHSG